MAAPQRAQQGTAAQRERDPWLGVRLTIWVAIVLALTILSFLGSLPARCDPQGNLIAFLSFRAGRDGLYAVDADRGTVCRLARARTASSIGSNHVTWSPAGDALAWIDDNQLFIQHLPDAAITPLDARNTGYEFPLAWSPDGSRIAIITFDYNATLTLAVVALEPPELLPLLEVERPVITREGPPPTSQLVGSRLAWSPTGGALLLDIGQQILRIDVDSPSSAQWMVRGRQPAWSPDGRHIAFSRDDALMVMAVDGTGERVLTPGAQYPIWSPDGRWIAFTRSAGLAVIAPDGSGERLLYPGPVLPMGDSNVASYAWSPDSRWLAVLGDTSPGSSTMNPLSIVGLDDGQTRQLIGQGMNRSLAWRPVAHLPAEGRP